MTDASSGSICINAVSDLSSYALNLNGLLQAIVGSTFFRGVPLATLGCLLVSIGARGYIAWAACALRYRMSRAPSWQGSRDSSATIGNRGDLGEDAGERECGRPILLRRIGQA